MKARLAAAYVADPAAVAAVQRSRRSPLMQRFKTAPPGQTAVFNAWEDAVECAKCRGRMVRTVSCYTCRDCGTNTDCI